MGQWGRPDWLCSVSNADDPRAFLITMILRNKGHLLKTAHELGIHRSTLYRRIDTMGLWPIVNQARRGRIVENAVNRPTEG